MAEFVLDRKSVLERLGGDEEIFGIMVDMFVADVENNCARLAQSLDAGECADLQREAHTVKGLLAGFSDSDGAALALHVEQCAREARLGGLAIEVGTLQQRLREVAGVLRS